MADDPGHVLDQVDAYLHELLPAAEGDRVKRHCDGCPACGAALEAARGRYQAMLSLLPAEAPEELIRRTERRLEGPWRRWRKAAFSRRGAAAAAVIVVALTGALHLYYLRLAPSPYDLCVLGQTRLLAGAESSLRVILSDATAKAGVAGVPVEIVLSGNRPGRAVTLARFETDDLGTGSPRLHVPDWEDGDYELRVTARPGGVTEEVRRTVGLRRSWQVLLSTDRPVYQPGQRILIRGLALRRPDLRPAGGADVVFTASDPKGNKIFREAKVTSRFGIASAELPLAEEVTEGTYQVECRVGEGKGSVAVEVKKYALPKFKVAVTTDRPYYKPGDTLKADVRADYFFGKPVAGGEVMIEVRTSDDPGKVKERLSARTDDHGAAEVRFTIPELPAKADEKDVQVSLTAEVTDPAGQRQAVTVARPVSARPFRIEVIPEGGELVLGVLNTVYLTTLYPDGRPARTEIEVVGIADKVRTDELGVATVEIPAAGAEAGYTVRARDADGRVGERKVTLPCGRQGDDFLLRTDKAVYDGGEAMRVTAVGGAGTVFLDLLKDGQTLWTGSFEPSGKQGECSIDLSPELSGVLELLAYRRDQPGVPRSKRRVVYVRQARQVDVRAEADRNEYRPGQVARVSFRLRDRAGKPAPGALSLAAVDEAVFSIPGRAPEGDSTLSAREQSLLQPVRSLYPWPLDEPAAAPAEGRSRLEQAAFARTAARGASEGRSEEQENFRRQLLPFLEGSERAFSAADWPQWEEVAGNLRLPHEVMALLRKDVAYSLSASTYPENARKVEAERRAGLETVHGLWGIYAAILGVILLICFRHALFRHTDVGCLVFLAITVVLIGLLLPAVQKVREASVRGMVTNDLKQLQLAVENYRATYGKPPWENLDGGGEAGPRVRQWFPETLLWRPELVTDDEGRAEVEVPLADSITDWRLTASAVTAGGRLGATQTKLRAFQPFFVDVNTPAVLTRGDEIAFPVVVYNYLDRPQSVTLTLDDAPWFERHDAAEKKLDLAAGAVRSVSFRLRARRVGRNELQVTARGDGVADAIKRAVEVVPDGPRTEAVFNGNLREPTAIDLAVPDDAVEGSVQALLRVYPSSFSQLVEGLDGIFQMPYGCFEQTSSTTYPNVLALDYLRRTGKSAPAVEAKAREYIRLGYQRLLTFEVAGGGFDWFGHPPANRTLTAYGLMEFEDMARVHDVDPALVERTRKWLLDQRRADGSWEPEGHGLEGGRGAGGEARLRETAYVAAAVFASGRGADEAGPTRDFLLRHDPASVAEPYTLALVCSALLAVDPKGDAALPYLARLEGMKRSADGGKVIWWQQAPDGRTAFYGAGRSGDVETTALACLALLHARRDPKAVRGSLTWLAGQRDSRGTWHSTQATVLALKALLAGTGWRPGAGEARRIEIALDGKAAQELVIPADQSEVLKQVNLAALVGKGKHRLTLTGGGAPAVDYQLAFSYHTPSAVRKEQEALAFRLTYDRPALKAGEILTATASVTNRRPQPAPMVMVELPVPPGFEPEGDDLDKLVQPGGAVAKVQRTARVALLYLRSLGPGQTLDLRYRLRAAMPGAVTAPAGVAYEYYDPDRVARSGVVRLNVAPAGDL